MSQTLPYAARPARRGISAQDWALTRERLIAFGIALAVVAAAHAVLLAVVGLDPALTLALFMAHLFCVGSGALRWCRSGYVATWNTARTNVLILVLLLTAYLAFSGDGGLRAVTFLPLMVFVWWSWSGYVVAGEPARTAVLVPVLLLTAYLVYLDIRRQQVFSGDVGFSFQLSTLRAVTFLPLMVFVWWWQGLRTWSGYVAGYVCIILMWWPLIRAGGGVNEINLLPLLVFVMLYGALFGRPWLLGYLFLYLAAKCFIEAYVLPATIVAAILYTTVPTFVRMFRRSTNRTLAVSYGLGLLLLVGVLMPVVYLLTGNSLQDLFNAAGQSDVRAALAVSLGTSAIAMVVVTFFGVPLAYALSRSTFRGTALLRTAVDLPIVIPPPVVGIALLIFAGPGTALGGVLQSGFHLIISPGSSLGQALGGTRCYNAFLIVLAQVFVSWPFLVRSSLVAFQDVDTRFERVARTLGASSLETFRRVTLPLAMRGIAVGMILCWLRAMAEFGSLTVLASFPKTAPLLTMEKFMVLGGLSEALPVAVLLVALSLAVFLVMWLVRAMPSRIAAVVRGPQGQTRAG